MKLSYYLKEGLIDVRYYEKDVVQGRQRVQVRLNGTPGVRVVNTNLGSRALLSDLTGEVLLLDSETLKVLGAPAEVLEGINVNEAIQALQN